MSSSKDNVALCVFGTCLNVECWKIVAMGKKKYLGGDNRMCLNLEISLLYFFTFFSNLELPSYNLLSFNWNTVCPILLLLQKCLACFKTSDGIFLLLRFLKTFSFKHYCP